MDILHDSALPTPVSLARSRSVGVISIDNPPVNALSAAVRAGLLDAINAVAADPDLIGAVIICAGKTFVAGSDLREFGAPLEEPQLPAVIAAIEGCPKPVVAALRGAALGGGYELALGCDFRLTAPGTVVGLPETTLGIIPGAGGTQRLPRLVGQAKAIELICTGARVDAQLARDLGMVDALTEGADLLAEAIGWVERLAGAKRRVMQRAVPAEPESVIEAAVKAGLKAGRNRPHIEAAIESVRRSATAAPEVALAAEREAFQDLRVGREAFAMRHLFFAEREAAKDARLAGVAPLPVNTVGVVGSGTMGSGIAISLLDAGVAVRLVDRSQGALDAALARVAAHYGKRRQTGRITAEVEAERLARLAPTQDLSSLADSDLVIEAVFESIETKRELFAELSGLLRPDAVLATNTSYLCVGDIAAAYGHPEMVIGLHFFSPAEVMRLVEVVEHPAAAPAALATGMAVGRRLGKLPILVGDSFGFVGNRIYAAYRRQCEFMLEEGAFPEDVDGALEAFGFAMGPFAVADLSGLDIAWRMRQATASSRNTSDRYVTIPDQLCELGRFGRKTGAGFYRYAPDERRGQADPQVRAIIVDASHKAGIARRRIEADEIVWRALGAMANAAAQVLYEGVARRAPDVDLALVNGFGFPRHEGGPVFWARSQPTAQLEAMLRRLAELSGPGFELAGPGALQALLEGP
ncbi:3-hydroxyacyl-CoA dehydrogenase NAD-binding domain-containing protein [Devosia sp.]|uniref:3-hydroxyacyl-CoA dehydrogenase NAD-binding domain-containing protein n=1 Tax=Devosia sp. TaxID=1871048 RepID=UPI002EDCA5DB